MNPDPILDEVWRIKDELAREAGNDIHVMCEQTRQWAKSKLPAGRNIFTAEELRSLANEEPAIAKH